MLNWAWSVQFCLDEVGDFGLLKTLSSLHFLLHHVSIELSPSPLLVVIAWCPYACTLVICNPSLASSPSPPCSLSVSVNPLPYLRLLLPWSCSHTTLVSPLLSNALSSATPQLVLHLHWSALSLPQVHLAFPPLLLLSCYEPYLFCPSKLIALTHKSSRQLPSFPFAETRTTTGSFTQLVISSLKGPLAP